MEDITGYSEQHFDEQFQRNIKRLTKNVHSIEKPVAFLLGGQSGAGKSTLHSIIKHNLKGNVIIIDGDTYRNQHPNALQLDEKYGKEAVNYKGEFAGRMVQEIYQKLSDQKYNLVIEGTLRTLDTPIKTATDLKEKGYSICLAVMAVSKNLSYIGTIERYEKTFSIDPNSARATPKNIHDQIVKILPTNIDTLYKMNLFEDVSLYERDGKRIFSSSKTPNLSPKHILKNKLDSKPVEEMKHRAKNVLKLMTINGHVDSVEYQILSDLVKAK